MLQPKRVKYRKPHSPRSAGLAHSGNTLIHGELGLKALEPAWITARQIEAARRVIVRYIRRGGKMWIRVYPDKPVTAKPAETRMGSGKGAPDHWVAVVRPGRIMFELAGIRQELAKEALTLAAYKLPIATTFVVREGMTAHAEAEHAGAGA